MSITAAVTPGATGDVSVVQAGGVSSGIAIGANLTGTNTLTLDSDVDSTGTGAITSSAGTLAATAASLTLNAATGIGTIAGTLPVDIGTVGGTLAATNTTSGDLFLSTGAITLGGAGAVLSEVAGGTLRVDSSGGIVVDGNVTVGGAGSIVLDATGTITRTGGTVTAATVEFGSNPNLTTPTSIGAGGTPIVTAATTLLDATSSAGDIWLSNTGALTVTGSATGGEFNLVNVGTIDTAGSAGAATVTLSGGEILDAANDALLDITGPSIDLDASTGIGVTANRELETSAATTVSADTTNGAIDIDHAATGATNLSSMTTGAGTLSYDQSGNQQLTAVVVTTGNGDVSLSASGGASGDIGLGAVTSDQTDDTVTIGATGGIYDSTGSDSIADVTAFSLVMTADSGGVGQIANGAVDLDVPSTTSVDTSPDSGNVALNVLATPTPLALVDAASGNINITASGDLTDGNGAGINVVATDLNVSALGGVDLNTTVDTTTIAATAAGDIVLTETDGIELTDLDTANGSITVAAGGFVDAIDVVSLTDADANDIDISTTSGDIEVDTVNAGAIGDVTLVADTVPGQSITDADAVSSVVADVLVATAQGSVGGVGLSVATTVGSADVSSTVSGDIFVAETDGLTLTDFDTVSGDITVSTTAGDLALANTIDLTSTAGNINDGGATSEVIAGSQARLVAETGILDLNTALGTVAAATDSGDLQIYDADALVVGTVNALIGAEIIDTVDDNSGTDSVVITTGSGTFSISSAVTNNDGGPITLAAEGGAASDDLTIGAIISVLDAGGTIDLYAGDRITQNAGITAALAGDIFATAGADYNAGATVAGNAGGDVVQGDGQTISSTSGNITISSPDSVTLSQLNTTGNITISADDSTYAVSDGVGAIVDGLTGEGPNAVGTALVLAAGSGIGDDIDSTVSSVDAINTTSNAVNIGETNAITVLRASQGAAADVSIATTNGSVFLDSGGAPANVVEITPATGTFSDLFVNDGVMTGGGTAQLFADRDIAFADEGDVSTSGGAIQIVADADTSGGGSGGTVTMSDGTISVVADEDIELGRLLTTNATATSSHREGS